jgi:hypothetical protein
MPREDGAFYPLQRICGGRRKLGAEELCRARLQFDRQRPGEEKLTSKRYSVLAARSCVRVEAEVGMFCGSAGWEARFRPGREIMAGGSHSPL